MSDFDAKNKRSRDDTIQQYLDDIKRILETHQRIDDETLDHEALTQGVLEEEIRNSELRELQSQLDAIHPADIAAMLEQLPLVERLLVWKLIPPAKDGDILLEVSEAVRETLIADMDTQELVAAAEQLDADEIADLAPDLPDDVIADVFSSLSEEERARLRAALSYPDDTVGALMDFEMVTVREDVSLDVVMRYLRRLESLPPNTDKLFVVDRREILIGTLLISDLIVAAPETKVRDAMSTDVVTFNPDRDAESAAHAFERYDLSSAPVIDAYSRIVGRITIIDIIDYIREDAEQESLGKVGLRDEDLFSSVWKSAKNRWLWLAVNLGTAFFASRVIGLFEHSIEKLVALAALMPIVAAIAGNSGNQTIALIVRAIAFEEINKSNAKGLLRKELLIALVNGILWGSVAGVFAWLLYGNIALGFVMLGAMLLNLIVAAGVGMLVPLVLQKMGRDPAIGSSVLLTFSTDSMGFLIFLGLATVFLV
ncbi:MAG: magnesium transporter [Burkholderiales bacterium]|nr:MAG: magnesium transporter [Betaproteobacteria bacterium TMED22]|tara:strand:+ start:22477 stop:23925 length:1449 start_codon:yes stop_codon:yes gene_type:complete